MRKTYTNNTLTLHPHNSANMVVLVTLELIADNLYSVGANIIILEGRVWFQTVEMCDCYLQKSHLNSFVHQDSLYHNRERCCSESSLQKAVSQIVLQTTENL